MDTRQSIQELIYRAALRMDAMDFEGFLSLCADGFRYIISAYSPEIRKDMVWLEHDRAGMASLFETLSRHNSDPSPLTRHLTVYLIDQAGETAQASVTSALQVFRTRLDGGATELFAVGKVYDTVTIESAGPRLLTRHIKLDTRMLGIGTHIPF